MKKKVVPTLLLLVGFLLLFALQVGAMPVYRVTAA